MKDIKGKVAVVTGGASGVGLAMCRRFGQEGMKVVIADVLEERVDEAEGELRGEGLEVTGVRTDVTDLASVQALAERTLDLYGGVHVLCNNAGVSPGGQIRLWDYEPNDWRWCIDVNVYGAAWGIRTFVPIMLDQGTEGHIVNTSSGNGGISPMGITPVYEVTKAAIVTMTEVLYLHLRDTPLSASVLFPGPGMLDTNLTQAWRTRPEEYASGTKRRAPHRTFEQLIEALEEGGASVTVTPLESVADLVFRGILEDRFWLLPDNPTTDDTLSRRTASIHERRNPDYFRAMVLPEPNQT